MSEKIIKVDNLGSEFDIGTLEAGKIHVTYNGQTLTDFLDTLVAQVDACCTSTPTPACCKQFLGFDVDSGLFAPGETTEFKIFNNALGTTQTIVHDYATTSDGINKSTWYTPIVAYINSIPNWSMTVVTDVTLPASGKVLYKVTYSGAVADSLRIFKGDVGTPQANMDNVGFKCDPSSGAGMYTVSNEYGTGVPFGSDPFSDC